MQEWGRPGRATGWVKGSETSSLSPEKHREVSRADWVHPQLAGQDSQTSCLSRLLRGGTMPHAVPGWCPESAPDRVPLYGNAERTLRPGTSNSDTVVLWLTSLSL